MSTQQLDQIDEPVVSNEVTIEDEPMETSTTIPKTFVEETKSWHIEIATSILQEGADCRGSIAEAEQRLSDAIAGKYSKMTPLNPSQITKTIQDTITTTIQSALGNHTKDIISQISPMITAILENRDQQPAQSSTMQPEPKSQPLRPTFFNQANPRQSTPTKTFPISQNRLKSMSAQKSDHAPYRKPNTWHCSFCEIAHKTDRCDAYPTAKSRIRRAFELQLCQGCLRHPRTYQCHRPAPWCDQCQESHLHTLCGKAFPE